MPTVNRNRRRTSPLRRAASAPTGQRRSPGSASPGRARSAGRSPRRANSPNVFLHARENFVNVGPNSRAPPRLSRRGVQSLVRILALTFGLPQTAAANILDGARSWTPGFLRATLTTLGANATDTNRAVKLLTNSRRFFGWGGSRGGNVWSGVGGFLGGALESLGTIWRRGGEMAAGLHYLILGSWALIFVGLVTMVLMYLFRSIVAAIGLRRRAAAQTRGIESAANAAATGAASAAALTVTGGATGRATEDLLQIGVGAARECVRTSVAVQDGINASIERLRLEANRPDTSPNRIAFIKRRLEELNRELCDSITITAAVGREAVAAARLTGGMTAELAQQGAAMARGTRLNQARLELAANTAAEARRGGGGRMALGAAAAAATAAAVPGAGAIAIMGAAAAGAGHAGREVAAERRHASRLAARRLAPGNNASARRGGGGRGSAASARTAPRAQINAAPRLRLLPAPQ